MRNIADMLLIVWLVLFAILMFDKTLWKETQEHTTCVILEARQATDNVYYKNNC